MKIKSLMFSLAIAIVAGLATATAAPVVYTANLDGPSESPPNASPGTGFAQITIDLALHTLQMDVTFSGLTGTVSAAHIHAATAAPGTGTAGVATQTSLSGFPIGGTSGTYSHIFDTLDAATYNPAYVIANGGTAASAEAALDQALADGKAYFNIHSSTFGGGEIRGFLVPEPATLGLIAMGGIGLLLAARKARRN